jgi:hypothetical protein
VFQRPTRFSREPACQKLSRNMPRRLKVVHTLPPFAVDILLPALLGHISARRRNYSEQCACGIRGGCCALLIYRQTRLSGGVKGILVAGLTVTMLVTCITTASAQNIFEALLGRLWTSPAPSADPTPPVSSPEATRSEGGVAFCVRLCDGRYFPVQRHSAVSSAQTCSSFCPASATKIYNGNGIEHAVGPDGKRYSELATAFAYRRGLFPAAPATARTPLALSPRPLLMTRHCVPATSWRPMKG